MKRKSAYWRYILLAFTVAVFCGTVLDFIGLSDVHIFIVNIFIVESILAFGMEAHDDPNAWADSGDDA